MDRLSTLVWFQTEDGQSGEKQAKVAGGGSPGNSGTKRNVRSYETSEEFEQAWRSITGVAHG
ncbi:MAG: DUF5361 domain-containing protein [Oscillospiraceae bacterium]